MQPAWMPQLEQALLNAIFRRQRNRGCALSSSKTENRLFYWVCIFSSPLICVAKFANNERFVGSRSNVLAA